MVEHEDCDGTVRSKSRIYASDRVQHNGAATKQRTVLVRQAEYDTEHMPMS